MSELVVNGDFETCDLTGWSAFPAGTSPTPYVVSDVAASGTCSVHLGNVPGGSGFQSGTSYITQRVTLPSGASQITFSVSYRAFSDNTHDYPYCQLRNTSGSSLKSLFSDLSNQNVWLTATADITAYAGSTVEIYCALFQDGSHISGAWFDDISVIATF